VDGAGRFQDSLLVLRKDVCPRSGLVDVDPRQLVPRSVLVSEECELGAVVGDEAVVRLEPVHELDEGEHAVGALLQAFQTMGKS